MLYNLLYWIIKDLLFKYGKKYTRNYLSNYKHIPINILLAIYDKALCEYNRYFNLDQDIELNNV